MLGARQLVKSDVKLGLRYVHKDERLGMDGVEQVPMNDSATMLYVRGVEKTVRQGVPRIQYFCYKLVRQGEGQHAYSCYELIDVFPDGSCEHSKSWRGGSVTNYLEDVDTILGSDEFYSNERCSKLEFDTMKALVLRLCKTNEEYAIPEALDVDPWD